MSTLPVCGRRVELGEDHRGGRGPGARKQIFEQVQRENDHIDWSQVDVGEPEEE